MTMNRLDTAVIGVKIQRKANEKKNKRREKKKKKIYKTSQGCWRLEGFYWNGGTYCTLWSDAYDRDLIEKEWSNFHWN